MGAAFLAGALTCIILFTSQGGTILPWSSPQLWITLGMGLVAIWGFIHEERSAAEPIKPLELFRQRTFLLSSLIGFIVGVSMFGSVTFLPLYLQVVKGSAPTEAGMQMLPTMGGLFVMWMVTGRLISKIGRYRMFPIAGTLLVAIAMMLLARLMEILIACARNSSAKCARHTTKRIARVRPHGVRDHSSYLVMCASAHNIGSIVH